MALDIAVDKSSLGTYTVTLAGTLDTHTAADLDQRVAPVLADTGARKLLLELHHLTFISSVGLGSIAKMRKAITARGGVMLIVGAQPQIARVFDIVKMMPKETVFTTRAEADKYLTAIQNQVIEENRPAAPADDGAL